MAFETDTIDLSMRDSETGAMLTANVYYMEGVNDEFGVQRPMSMSQLLLAICMQRASEVEEKIIAIMDEMNVNTDTLEGLTAIEAALVDGETNIEKIKRDDIGTPFRWVDEQTGELKSSQSASDMLVGIGIYDFSSLDTDALLTEIESKMDEYNSISQELLIDLQSNTAKRDQCYDFASNGIKAFNTVLTGIANNL